MKILYTISNDTSLGSGAGGHYYSLLALANAMSQKNEIRIASFGNRACNMYKDIQIPYHHINTDIEKRKYAAKKASELVKINNITHIHSFDVQSHKISDLTSKHTGARRVSTKPGGPSPTLWYPFCEDTVLFSGEDLDWFKKAHKFKNARLHLIPNRYFPENNKQLAEEQLPGIRKEDQVVMSITRFNKNKLDQFVQSIRLTEILKEKNKNTKLIFIGKIQNKETFECIKKEAPEDALFFTDELHTLNASRFYNLATYVVASGRGVFEASYFNKPVFIPSEQSLYPILLSKETAEQLKYFNFSNRCKLKTDETEVKKQIQYIQQNKNKYDSFILDFFIENLSISNVIDKYESIYNQSSRLKHVIFDRYEQALINKLFN